MFLIRKCPISNHLGRTMSSGKNNLYSVLGVKSSATQVEIKSAYYELSKIYHPDSNKGSVDSLAKFRQVNDAYEVLGNVSSRKLYDRGLVVGGSATVLREDVELDPTVRFYKQREKRHQVPTPLDRETVYDFDAWTRAHYQFAKTRKFTARVKYDNRMDRRARVAELNKLNRTIIGAGLIIFSVFGLIELICREDNDVDKISDKKMKDT